LPAGVLLDFPAENLAIELGSAFGVGCGYLEMYDFAHMLHLRAAQNPVLLFTATGF